MKVLHAWRYQTREFLRSAGIFYLVMVLVSLVSLILTTLLTDGQSGGQTSVEGSSLVFVFVLGLNGFKNPFRLYVQNGISRVTHFIGFVLTSLGLVLCVVAVDSLFPLVFRGAHYVSLYDMIYDFTGFLTGETAKLTVTGLLWNAGIHLALMCTGFFLTTLYYRMNKPMKLLVSIGVPGLLLVVLPLLETLIPSFHVMSSTMRFFGRALGISMTNPQPLRAVGSFGIWSAAMLGCSFLLMRRATLKEGA